MVAYLSRALRRFPLGFAPSLVGDGVSAATSVRAQATATASATPHTKGPWTAIIAATTSPISSLLLSITAATGSNGVDTSTLLDIGIGSAGNEVVVVPNLAIGYQITLQVPLYQLPITIPVGSRIAIRCQSAVVSKTVAAQLVGAQLPNTRRESAIVDLGTNLAASQGVALPAPSPANTKTAWTEIVAATADAYDALVVGVQGLSDLAMAAGGTLVDVGMGAAGSEVVIAPDLPLLASGNEAYTWGVMPLVPYTVPKGSRLAVRWQSVSTTNSMDAQLYGVRR